MTSHEVDRLKELVKNPQKWSNSLADLVEDTKPHNQPRNKKNDPTKKVSKEAQLQFKRDLKEYKKSQGWLETDKVFYIEEYYLYLREEFLQRGWRENKDVKSPFFDFKYTSKFRDIDLFLLQPSQIVNHVIGSSSFTKKIGLCQFLRSSIWEANLDVDQFFPKCYEISESAGFFNFVQDYRAIESFNTITKCLNNRITNYQPDEFKTFLTLLVYTSILMKRSKALVQFPKVAFSD